ncbi:hypothetical protein BC354_19150 [Vibrio cholerae]|nr:hypothetical protein BC354_19150 [Vibrio cholerae]RGP95745.1 hypothetical protein BC352_18580 [Vibrio cholerae]
MDSLLRNKADNISFEVLAATPFSHKISTSGGELGSLGDIGETKHLPPTFMVQYYFGEANSTFRPYVGAGLNYTTFLALLRKRIIHFICYSSSCYKPTGALFLCRQPKWHKDFILNLGRRTS